VTKCFLGSGETASRAGFGLWTVVWRPWSSALKCGAKSSKNITQVGKSGYISELSTFLPFSFIQKNKFHLSRLQISPWLVLSGTLLYIRKHLYCAWALKKCLKLSTVKSTRHDTIFLFLSQLWGYCQIFAAFFGRRSF